MTTSTAQLSQIFREIEAEKGTTDLTEFVIDTLDLALDSFQAKGVEDIYKQFYQLFSDIKSTQPRIALVIYFFYDIWEELQKEKENVKNTADFREIVERIAKHISVKNEDDFLAVVDAGVNMIEENDVILIHSHSGTVRDILTDAKDSGKKFSVLVAEQETEKTIDHVSYLSAHDIPFTVVPEYMLSHIIPDVTKVFFGATTLNYEQNFVCDAGTYSILTEFHEAGIESYMFLSSKKFSLWKSSVKHNTYRTKQKKVYVGKDKVVNFDRIKFSHDRVPANLFHQIVTEDGAYTPNEIKKVYDTLYTEREEMRKKFFSDAAGHAEEV